MPKLHRKMLYMGPRHDVSLAVVADGSSPAEIALKAMLTGDWDKDPEAVEEGIPSDTQIQKRALLLARIRYFAKNGVCSSGHMNSLRGGVWEFKEGQKRVSFFDTLGDGTFVPKYKFKNREEADCPEDKDWEIPIFDRDVRLGHCFGKPWDQQKTTELDIECTIRVREEDLAHDGQR